MTAVPWVGLGNTTPPPPSPRQVFLVKVAPEGFSWLCRGVVSLVNIWRLAKSLSLEVEDLAVI